MPDQPLRSATHTAGACEIVLELDRDAAKPGEVLTGRIRIRGGNYEQQLDHLRVELIARIAGRGWEGFSRTAWETLQIAPKERRQLEFSLLIPEAVTALTERTAMVYASYGDESRIVIGTEVTIPLAVGYYPLADCVADLAGIPATEWTLTAQGDAMAARFVPTGAARELFDELRLEIYHSGGTFYGHLMIDPRERTLADRLKALAGADRRRFPFRFSSGSAEEVRIFFEQCLRPYLDAVRHLPIPSGATPRNTSDLPRPSGREEGAAET